MTKNYLFAYGTLQLPEIQKQVLGRELKHIEQSVVDDYTLEQIEIDGIYYIGAVQAWYRYDHHSVKGNVYKIKKSDLKLLDEFETNAYRRINIGGSTDRIYMYIIS